MSKMEIVWEGEKAEEKPLTLAGIKIGERFRYRYSSTYGRGIYRRVEATWDNTVPIYLVNESDDRLSKPSKGLFDAEVERIDPEPKPKRITLGDLEAGDHFALFMELWTGVEPIYRVLAPSESVERGYVRYLAEKDNLIYQRRSGTEICPIKGVKLVIPMGG